MKWSEELETDVQEEFEHLDADRRLRTRSRRMLNKWIESPGLGFPQIFSDDADLEAAYRFFGNSSLSFADLIAAHGAKTVERCNRFDGDILCIQDTSTFIFSGERADLGFINKNNHGFLGHFCLAVGLPSNTSDVVPLGVAAASVWTRTEPGVKKKVAVKDRRSLAECESHRWRLTSEQLEVGFENTKCHPIHVMDREGDIYDVISTMVATDARFVIRSMTNRLVESDEPDNRLLWDELEGLPQRYTEEITVSPRKGVAMPDQKRKYPARKGRIARTCVTATTTIVQRTKNSSESFPAKTPLNIVHVFEPNPPKKEQPVEWVLLTNEPVDTDDDIRKIVNIYRRRWLIEEFFKSIKTGCSFEKRQLESFHALGVALGMTLPVAWHLLLLRTQSRVEKAPPASQYMTEMRIKILKARVKRYKIPEEPTMRDIAYAIASLGGHLKRNGPPGWQTLKRGYETLLLLEEGWIMSTESCDQS